MNEDKKISSFFRSSKFPFFHNYSILIPTIISNPFHPFSDSSLPQRRNEKNYDNKNNNYINKKNKKNNSNNDTMNKNK